ncbi:hypothetical protein ACJJTC_010570 [Scirpophaga incertulas]
MTSLVPHEIEKLENKLMWRMVPRFNSSKCKKLEPRCGKTRSDEVTSTAAASVQHGGGSVHRDQRRNQRMTRQLLANSTTPKQPSKKKVPLQQSKMRAPKNAAVVIPFD